jgi:hypothetical protein
MTEINTLVACRERALELLMGAERVSVLRTLPGVVRAWILETARAAWERQGLRVLAVTASTARALRMEDATAIRAFEVTALLGRLDLGITKLDDETVVILDAGYIPQPLYTRLRVYIDRAGARFVRVEDARI